MLQLIALVTQNLIVPLTASALLTEKRTPFHGVNVARAEYVTSN